MSVDPGGDRGAVLRHPDLRRYLSARFIGAVATQVQTVAVGWQPAVPVALVAGPVPARGGGVGRGR